MFAPGASNLRTAQAHGFRYQYLQGVVRDQPLWCVHRSSDGFGVGTVALLFAISSAGEGVRPVMY